MSKAKQLIEADGEIDRVGGEAPAAAEGDDAHADAAGVDGGNEAGVRGHDITDNGGRGQVGVHAGDEVDGAAEERHHLREMLERLAAAERGFDCGARIASIAGKV